MIRQATKKDLLPILGMLCSMHGETRYSVFPLNKEKLSCFVENMIDNALVLICDEGVFIGMVSEMYFSDCLMASDVILYVKPEHRGKGIGGELAMEYIDWAVNNGAKDIGLSTSTGLSSKAIERIASRYEMEKTGMSFKVKSNV